MTHNIQTVPGLPFLFKGAYIESFSASHGWNTSPSTLSMTVIEEKTKIEKGPAAFSGSAIKSLKIGKFFGVSIGSFSFGGLLQSTKYTEEVSSGKKWEVQLVDPRELMGNSVVILAPSDGTTKAFGGRRVIDVFNELGGLFESRWTSTGMPWDSIKKVFAKPTIAAMEGVDDVFKLDLTDLNAVIDPEYRIAGTLLTVADLIQQGAKAAGVDWYVEATSAANPVVKIKVVDRSVDSEPISLASFAAQFGYDTDSSLVRSIQVGKEWRNEVGCAILQSAPLEFLSKETPTTAGLPTLDLINEGFGEFVPTEEGMRTALYDQFSWEFYMVKFHKKQTGGTLPDFFNSLYDALNMEFEYEQAKDLIASQEITGKNKKYYGKRKLQELDGQYEGQNFVLNESIKEYLTRTEQDVLEYDRKVGIIKTAYEKYRDYANKHYGKTFIYFKDQKVPEFVEEVGTAFTRGTANKDGLPEVVARFFEDDSGQGKQVFKEEDQTRPGKTRAVVSFANVTITKSEIQKGKFIIGGQLVEDPVITTETVSSMQDAIVSGKVVFDGFDPKDFLFSNGVLYVAANTSNAVATINPVWFIGEDKFSDSLGKTLQEDMEKGIAAGKKITDAELRNIDNLVQYLVGAHKRALRPTAIWVPLRSKISYWNVWRSSKCEVGAMSVEQDTSLDPFNFGSFALMDEAGQRKVNKMGTGQVEADVATFNVVGMPVANIATAVGKNSHVSNISVAGGIGGFSTTYTVQSFTRRFGETSKDQIDNRAFVSNRFKEQQTRSNEKLLQEIKLLKDSFITLGTS